MLKVFGYTTGRWENFSKDSVEIYSRYNRITYNVSERAENENLATLLSSLADLVYNYEGQTSFSVFWASKLTLNTLGLRAIESYVKTGEIGSTTFKNAWNLLCYFFGDDSSEQLNKLNHDLSLLVQPRYTRSDGTTLLISAMHTAHIKNAMLKIMREQSATLAELANGLKLLDGEAQKTVLKAVPPLINNSLFFGGALEEFDNETLFRNLLEEYLNRED